MLQSIQLTATNRSRAYPMRLIEMMDYCWSDCGIAKFLAMRIYLDRIFPIRYNPFLTDIYLCLYSSVGRARGC